MLDHVIAEVSNDVAAVLGATFDEALRHKFEVGIHSIVEVCFGVSVVDLREEHSLQVHHSSYHSLHVRMLVVVRREMQVEGMLRS